MHSAVWRVRCKLHDSRQKRLREAKQKLTVGNQAISAELLSLAQGPANSVSAGRGNAQLPQSGSVARPLNFLRVKCYPQRLGILRNYRSSGSLTKSGSHTR